MLKLIGTFIALGALLLGSVETASAHGRVYNNYDPPNHYRAGIHRGIHRHGHMPGWLQHNKGFRKWYYRSSLRHNRQLAWQQLYEIYHWERRYDRQRHYSGYYGGSHHSYDWYRRYWRDYEHRGRDRRHNSRYESRYETRRRNRHDD